MAPRVEHHSKKFLTKWSERIRGFNSTSRHSTAWKGTKWAVPLCEHGQPLKDVYRLLELLHNPSFSQSANGKQKPIKLSATFRGDAPKHLVNFLRDGIHGNDFRQIHVITHHSVLFVCLTNVTTTTPRDGSMIASCFIHC